MLYEVITSEKGVLEVWNRSDFTNASHWESTWTLTEDDKVLQQGVLELNVLHDCIVFSYNFV